MRNILIAIIILLLIVGVVFFMKRSRKLAHKKEKAQTEQQAPALQDNTAVVDTIQIGTHPEFPAVEASETVSTYAGFSLLYDEAHEQARWVAYELTQAETNSEEERSNHFIPDPAISTNTASDEDYARSGYDRGHLAPAGDMGWSKASMQESFYYSNMSPQVPAFNRGIWKKLESCVRNWASEHESIYVVTGPILTDGLTTIGPNKVSVPAYYYKVIVDINKPEMHGIGFIMANEASKSPLSDFAVTIDSVEKVTGLDFFHSIPGPLIEDLERQNCYTCW
jgi:endonuclease G